MKRRFGDFRIFVSDKNPRKNVREHKVIKLILFFDKKNKSVIKKIIPPENGGVIFWFIKVLCVEILFLSFKKENFEKE